MSRGKAKRVMIGADGVPVLNPEYAKEQLERVTIGGFDSPFALNDSQTFEDYIGIDVLHRMVTYDLEVLMGRDIWEYRRQSVDVVDKFLQKLLKDISQGQVPNQSYLFFGGGDFNYLSLMYLIYYSAHLGGLTMGTYMSTTQLGLHLAGGTAKVHNMLEKADVLIVTETLGRTNGWVSLSSLLSLRAARGKATIIFMEDYNFAYDLLDSLANKTGVPRLDRATYVGVTYEPFRSKDMAKKVLDATTSSSNKLVGDYVDMGDMVEIMSEDDHERILEHQYKSVNGGSRGKYDDYGLKGGNDDLIIKTNSEISPQIVVKELDAGAIGDGAATVTDYSSLGGDFNVDEEIEIG